MNQASSKASSSKGQRSKDRAKTVQTEAVRTRKVRAKAAPRTARLPVGKGAAAEAIQTSLFDAVHAPKPERRERTEHTSAGRVACVVLPVLPLQELLRERPEWRRNPVAVVAEDRPEAPLTHVNERARRHRLHEGMRYGTARDLVPDLRAGVVSPERVEETLEELTTALQTFSPRVEADLSQPGVFYVDPNGLEKIYGGLRSWSEAVHAYFAGRGYRCSVVVGWGRFPTYAIARSREGKGGALVLRSERETRDRAEEVPLDRIGIRPDLRDALAMLGVTTLGDFAALPAGELHTRFGAEASRLHERFLDDPQLPMQPRAFDEPVRVGLEVDPPDADHARLLFALKGAMHDLVLQVSSRNEVVSALRLELTLEDGETHRERLEPAAPTRDEILLLDLLRLRLAEVSLPSRVEAMTLEAESADPDGDQLALFQVGPKRDLSAGDRALARVRATFGERSVSQAQLRDAHLPEASYTWEPLSRLRRPRVDRQGLDQQGLLDARRELGTTRASAKAANEAHGGAPAPLVRRLLARPKALSARDHRTPESGPDLPLAHLYGPYRISGGWWVRTVERDYYYAEAESGELLWLYFDRPRKRWFLQGTVD